MKAKNATKWLVCLAAFGLLASCNTPVDPGDNPGGDTPVVPTKVLTNINLNTDAVKKTYEVGEALDLTGLVVMAKYDDNSTEEVTNYTTNPANGTVFTEEGEKTITVTFEGKTDTFTVEVGPFVKRAWTDEEKALFDEYLHGIELPFFDVEGATVVLNDEAEQLNIVDEEGNFLAVEGEDVPNYAAKFTAADGWDDVSDEYNAYSTAPVGSFFVFEKSTETAEGMRRISVQFFGHNGTTYALDGEFHLYASDPFNYEFPAAEMAAEFAKYGMPGFTIVAPDGDGLFYEFYPDSYNDLYHQYGMDDYLNAEMYIYGLDQNGFGAYLTKLGTNGWVFGEPSQGLYTGTKEIADLGIATINLGFAGSFTYLAYDYMLASLPVTTWPTDGVAALVEAAVPGSTTVIPQLISDEITNYVVDDYYNELDVYGPSTLKATYAAILLEAGWTEGSAADYYISPNGDVQIRLVYSTTYGLRIIISAVPVWPTDGVAALVQKVAPGSTTVVPALPNGTAYQFYGTYELDVYGPNTLLAAYVAILEDAGWTADANAANTYISPAQDVALGLNYSTTYKCLEITFSS